MIDSSASVNLLDEMTVQRIDSSGNKNLKPTRTKIYSYGCEFPLPLLGTFTAVKSSNASTSAPLLVVKGRRTRRTKSIGQAERSPCWRSGDVLFRSKKED